MPDCGLGKGEGSPQLTNHRDQTSSKSVGSGSELTDVKETKARSLARLAQPRLRSGMHTAVHGASP